MQFCILLGCGILVVDVSIVVFVVVGVIGMELLLESNVVAGEGGNWFGKRAGL